MYYELAQPYTMTYCSPPKKFSNIKGPILGLCRVQLLHFIYWLQFETKYFHQKYLKIMSVWGCKQTKCLFSRYVPHNCTHDPNVLNRPCIT